MPAHRISEDRTLLEGNGFVWAGTASFGHPKQKLYARFRVCVRTAGDGLALGGNTILPPTAMEQAAIEEVMHRYTLPLSEARLAELQAMGKQDVTPE